MAQRVPLVLSSAGQVQQLQSGDTLKVPDGVSPTDAVALEQLSTVSTATGQLGKIMLSGDINNPEILFDIDGTIMIDSTP